MAWWRTDDGEIERQRLQAWKQFALALAMQAAPVSPFDLILDTFNVWFWKRAILRTERKSLGRRIKSVKRDERGTQGLQERIGDLVFDLSGYAGHKPIRFAVGMMGGSYLVVRLFQLFF